MTVYAVVYIPMEVDEKFYALTPAVKGILTRDQLDELEDELAEIADTTVTFSSSTVSNWTRLVEEIAPDVEDEEGNILVAR